MLKHELDAGAEARFTALKTAFSQLASSQEVWHIEAAGRTHDWKRNAGATGLVGRGSIRPGRGSPPRVEMNITVPTLPAGRQHLYFMPDQILVYEGSRVGAVAYSELRANAGLDVFSEDRPVPPDARVIGTTWRYVNKNGGPDRRFNKNRQFSRRRGADACSRTRADGSAIAARFSIEGPSAAACATGHRITQMQRDRFDGSPGHLPGYASPSAWVGS